MRKLNPNNTIQRTIVIVIDDAVNTDSDFGGFIEIYKSADSLFVDDIQLLAFQSISKF